MADYSNRFIGMGGGGMGEVMTMTKGCDTR